MRKWDNCVNQTLSRATFFSNQSQALRRADIFLHLGLFEHIFHGVCSSCLHCGAVFNLSVAADISQSQGARLMGLRIPPRPGMGTGRIEIT